MQKTIKGMLALIAVLVIVLLAAGCGKQNVVATVNGEAISRQQLDEMVADMKKYYAAQGLDLDQSKDAGMIDKINSMALDQLINQTVLVQEARKMGIKATQEDIDKEIDKYKKSMTEDKFVKFLQDNNITASRLRDMVEKDIIISSLQKKILEDVKPATLDQARDYYEKNKSEFMDPVKYQVRHILLAFDAKETDKAKADLEAKTKAEAILAQLKQGKDFAALAKEKSEDPGTAAQGGLFTFSPGEAVPEFEKAAEALKPGEMTQEPVKTTYGYHIIKLEKIIPEKQKSFDEVKKDIMDKLTNEANQEKINNFLEDAKKKAKIVNYLEKPADNKAGQ